MKLAIMQPYFFPYVGYFSLMEYADRFVFFDTPQYISRGWVNRNRLMTTAGDPVYMTVPIRKMPRETAINEIMIDDSQNWKEKIYGQLTAYKKRAPYFKQTTELVRDILDGSAGDSLSKLNIISTMRIAKEIGIDCAFDTFSEMDLAIGEVHAPDEWALEISKAMGAETYVNPPGGMEFFDKSKYDRAGIALEYLKSNLKPYVQRVGKWVPALSIIDVMMFCTKDEIRDILKDYTIL